MLPGRWCRDNSRPAGNTARGYGGERPRFHYVFVTRISTVLSTVAETFGWRNCQATHPVKRGLVVSIPSCFRGPARRDAAAFYLAQLAQGILMGELDVLTGHEAVTVRPTDFLVLEIAFTRKVRVNHVSVRVQWRRRPDPTGAPPRRRGAGDLPARSRPGGHPEFTSPSSRRNAEARDSHTDADHR
jgi:hypothetical protein